MVELGSLENCCAGDRTVGSNPTLSAIREELRLACIVFVLVHN